MRFGEYLHEGAPLGNDNATGGHKGPQPSAATLRLRTLIDSDPKIAKAKAALKAADSEHNKSHDENAWKVSERAFKDYDRLKNAHPNFGELRAAEDKDMDGWVYRNKKTLPL